ncbi:hypothetical protein QIA05_05275 (plasmid) [Borreliella burgdorferi]|uniref:hypothetical protein n=1 Tax=Borreliella burgdorferi TaxID=139 RepID=UPI003AF1B625
MLLLSSLIGFVDLSASAFNLSAIPAASTIFFIPLAISTTLFTSALVATLPILLPKTNLLNSLVKKVARQPKERILILLKKIIAQ